MFDGIPDSLLSKGAIVSNTMLLEDEIKNKDIKGEDSVRLLGVLHGGKKLDKIIEQSSFTLGRSEDKEENKNINHVSLGDNIGISRIHAKIQYNNTRKQFEITCASKNGLYVDGLYMTPEFVPRALHSRSLIQISKCLIYFLLPNMMDKDTATESTDIKNGDKEIVIKEKTQQKQQPQTQEPQNQQQQQQNSKMIGKKWNRTDREKFRYAILNWGIGAWDKIQEEMKDSRSKDEIIIYAAHFLHSLCDNMPKELLRFVEHVQVSSDTMPPSLIDWPQRDKKAGTWGRMLLIIDNFLQSVAAVGNVELLLKDVSLPGGRKIANWWTRQQDVDLLIGAYRYGFSAKGVELMKIDEKLSFLGIINRQQQQQSEQQEKTASLSSLPSVDNNINNQIQSPLVPVDAPPSIIPLFPNSNDNTPISPINDSPSEENKYDESNDMIMSTTATTTTTTSSSSSPSSELMDPWPHMHAILNRFKSLVNTIYQHHVKRDTECMTSKKRKLTTEETAVKKQQKLEEKRKKEKLRRMQSWNQRDRDYFIKCVINFGKPASWDVFRQRHASLAQKTDEVMDAMFEKVMIVAKQVDENTEEAVEFPISNVHAWKIISRVEFFHVLRNIILKDPHLKEILLQFSPMNVPSWWSDTPDCDYNLLLGVDQFGFSFDEVLKTPFFAQQMEKSNVKPDIGNVMVRLENIVTFFSKQHSKQAQTQATFPVSLPVVNQNSNVMIDG